MAISKIILNGEVQMDVTSDTVTAGSMLSGTTATKNDGTKATGTIASKSSSDLTASGATVTAPAGYYSASASKSVTTMTLPTTTSTSATSGYTSKATLDRSTSDRYLNIAPGYNSAGGYYKINKVANGSVTAPSSISGTSATLSAGTNTLTLSKSVSVTPNVTTAGYISSGTAGNSSVSLTATATTQGATTYNTSTSDQTISASRWLTGSQTIKAVTTSNLTAENIADGVNVKVGDANNAGRIVNITGTHKGSTPHTATLLYSSGDATNCYVQHNGVKYYTDNSTFTFYDGDTLTIYAKSNGSGGAIFIIGDSTRATTSGTTAVNTTYIMPGTDVDITLAYSYRSNVTINLKDYTLQEVGDMGIITPTDVDQSFTVDSSHYGFNNFMVAAASGGGHTCTLTNGGNATKGYVEYDYTQYYSANDTFSFEEGGTLTIYNSYGMSNYIYVNGVRVAYKSSYSAATYDYTLPNCDVSISFSLASGNSKIYIYESLRSNYVNGRFTTVSTAGSTQVVTVPYTGNGYPVMMHIEVMGDENGSDGFYTWLNQSARTNRTVGLWFATKNNWSTTPNYNGDMASISTMYATGSKGQYLTNSNLSVYWAAPSPDPLPPTTVVAFQSSTQFSIYTLDSSTSWFGLAPSTSYVYDIVYSE